MIKKKFKLQDKPEYKCFYFYDNDPFHYKIYKELGKISKNIYNISIYSIQVFNYFKIELYKNLSHNNSNGSYKIRGRSKTYIWNNCSSVGYICYKNYSKYYAYSLNKLFTKINMQSFWV